MILCINLHRLFPCHLHEGCTEELVHQFFFVAVVKEFSEFDQSSPNCVVLGDAQGAITYQRLNRAFQLLLEQPDTKLITMGIG
jgi:phospholysine phosphohistidine inorganic pyrophosphate phosphatase